MELVSDPSAGVYGNTSMIMTVDDTKGFVDSYEKALAYVKEKGYKLAVPCREIYLKGPGMIFKGNPKNYLTEIQLMIEGDADERPPSKVKS